jgi:hypothetical protein
VGGAGGYTAWRSTRLGSAVEAVETALVFRLVRDTSGVLLDAEASEAKRERVRRLGCPE